MLITLINLITPIVLITLIIHRGEPDPGRTLRTVTHAL
jgi:hypothetical protein